MKTHTIYYLMRGGVSFFYNMWLTVTLLYHTTMVTEDPLYLILLGVALEASIFIFQIPTGMIADTYSRKLSIVLGLLLTGIAYILEGAFVVYAIVLLAHILYGLGFSFYSGANDAWIADEVGSQNVAPIFMRGSQISLITGQLGILSAIVIGQAGLNIPLLVAGVGYVVIGFMAMILVTEDGFTPEKSSAKVLTQLINTFRKSTALIQKGSHFTVVVMVGVIVGLSLGGYDRLFTPHFLLNFESPVEPIIWFGLLSALVSLSSAIVLEWIRKRANSISNENVPKLIGLLYSGTILGNVVFVVAGNFELAIVAYWFSQMLRTTIRPLIIVWITGITPSAVRASAISMYWQSTSFGQVLGSPVIGVIGRIASIQWALMISSVLALSPVVWLLTHVKPEPADEQK